MNIFKDALAREWIIEIKFGKLKQIKDTLGLDLLDLQGETYKKLSLDMYLIADLIFEVVREQAEQKGIDYKNFTDSLANLDVINDGLDKVFGEVINFFQKPIRESLIQTTNRQAELNKAVMKKWQETIDAELNLPIEQIIEKMTTDVVSK